MLLTNADPIIAIATAPGRGAVGIIRLSGKDLTSFASKLCRQNLKPRYATYLAFKDQQDAIIDSGLALYFPAPHSYTGEDVLELQIHGGSAVMQLLLNHCLNLAAMPLVAGENQQLLPFLRLAKPGEFTERAFLNAKLDLAQAEAVADLIDATTTTAVKSAGLSLSGAFSKEVNTLVEKLINLRMLVEATLDFPEEELEFLQNSKAQEKLSLIMRQLLHLRAVSKQGALLREGIKVVIAGQPNAGKSSLLNKLAGQDLAIVTPIAGTTRDKVSQTIQLDGVPLHIIDTAGLRDASDTIEQIGIERTWNEISAADVILFVHDLTRQTEAQYLAEDARISANLPSQIPCLDLWNKLDAVAHQVKPKGSIGSNQLYLSILNDHGINELKEQLLAIAGWENNPEGLYLARERHLQAISKAAQHLSIAEQHLAEGQNFELLAEELRLAQSQLNQITGEFNADDLLGEIFSKFCIGK